MKKASRQFQENKCAGGSLWSACTQVGTEKGDVFSTLRVIGEISLTLRRIRDLWVFLGLWSFGDHRNVEACIPAWSATILACEYISGKRKNRADVVLWVNGAGALLAEDIEQGEILKAFITSVFTSKTSLQKDFLDAESREKNLEQGKHTVARESVQIIFKQTCHTEVHEPSWDAPKCWGSRLFTKRFVNQR